MSSALEIDGKTLHPIKDAANVVSYSRDYVTRLAREGKIVAQSVGRQWFVDLDSLRAYSDTSLSEQQIRKRQLSEERKRERRVREAVLRQRVEQAARARRLEVKSAVVAVAVLMLGASVGFVSQQISPWVQSFGKNISLTEIASGYVPAALSSGVALTQQAQPDQVFAEAGVVVGTKNVQSLGEVEQGVLLLPAAGTASTSDLFSDEVVVTKLADGTAVVVQVDSDGKQVGRTVPFVTVPVKQEEM